MATITDFEGWLEEAAPDDFEEIHSLYRAVLDVDEFGAYKCTKDNNKYFLKGDHTEDTLMLASDNARSAFMEYMDARFEIEGSLEGWYSYKRGMAKDD